MTYTLGSRPVRPATLARPVAPSPAATPIGAPSPVSGIIRGYGSAGYEWDEATGYYVPTGRPVWATSGELAELDAPTPVAAATVLPPAPDRYWWEDEGTGELVAPVRPRHSLTYRRVRALVRFLALAFMAGLLFLGGAAVQGGNLPAFLAAILPLLACASLLLFGEALDRAGRRA